MIDNIKRVIGMASRGARAMTNPDQPGGALKRNMPLVPAASISGRALVIVIAIMAFLASIVTGMGVLVHTASRGWTESISREITIQVRPSPRRNIEDDVKKAVQIAQSSSGVASVRVFGKAESEKLLEPWLGSGLDLGELPVPRMIVVALNGAPKLDTEQLKLKLREQAPTASLDDHQLWIERLVAMSRALVLVVAVILLLVLVSMGLAVGFATRGAMAGNKDIVDILHYVGAADHFIAREFQQHFFRLGLRGAAIGSGCAIAIFLISETLSRYWAQGPGGDEIEALFGAFSLGASGYVAIVVIGAGIAILTGLVSRIIVFRHLRGLS
jgi:cell division transport system permease protein